MTKRMFLITNKDLTTLLDKKNQRFTKRCGQLASAA